MMNITKTMITPGVTYTTSSAFVFGILKSSFVEAMCIMVSTIRQASLKLAAAALRKISFEISRARVSNAEIYSPISCSGRLRTSLPVHRPQEGSLTTSFAKRSAKESNTFASTGNTRIAREPCSSSAASISVMKSSMGVNSSSESCLQWKVSRPTRKED